MLNKATKTVTTVEYKLDNVKITKRTMCGDKGYIIDIKTPDCVSSQYSTLYGVSENGLVTLKHLIEQIITDEKLEQCK